MNDSVVQCAHCGKTVNYVGFMSVECGTRGCPNYASVKCAAAPPAASFSSKRDPSAVPTIEALESLLLEYLLD